MLLISNKTTNILLLQEIQQEKNVNW